jgi:hypothetical protein
VWLPDDAWCALPGGHDGSSCRGWHAVLPRRPGASPQPLPHQRALQRCYTQLPELLQHARQLQQVQALLLQLTVESTAAPRLLELLLRGCLEAAEAGGEHVPATRQRGSVQPGARMTAERCCALYRLVCALAAGPVKQRGLGPSCQLVEEVQVADAAAV